MSKVSIKVLRDLAANAGFDASNMRTASEVRNGLAKLLAEFPSLCDQHIARLDEQLRRAGV